MRFLVLQHHPAEHPGILRDFLAADGIAWDPVELDAGEAIPSLDGYDALWVFGGPMDVWQEDQHPWLVPEKALIREAVTERNMPFLGVCLGHQLLAEALGGKVGPMQSAEVGVCDVDVTPAGHALLGGETGPLKALQWHGAEVAELPPGGEILASSPVSACQALRCGDRAFSIQYHVEVTARTVPEWSEITEYRAALEASIGAEALPAFKTDVSANLTAFNASARRLYDGFIKTLS